jgi:hypothetical protein
MKKLSLLVLIGVLCLSACGKKASAAPPVTIPATATTIPAATATPVPPTDTPLPPTETPIPAPTQDPAVFGAIGTGEIQAFALESVVSAIFTKTLERSIAEGSVQEYQVTSITVFPGGDGLLAEVIYNVRSSDPAWLADGGAQAADGWVNGNCSRFDFFTTETEYQLKNRRLCS